MSEPPTLYEWAQGRPAIERLIGCFYDRVERDDLLSPPRRRRSRTGGGPYQQERR
jgi:truncated hemoglobin YjbI